MAKDTWTEKMIELLKEAVKTQMSNTEITDHINALASPVPPISRNAVIGKRTRLGLEVTNKVGKRPSNKKGPRTSVMRIKMPQTFKPLPREILTPQTVANVTLMGLLDGLCKWPVGELYCGMVTENARTSYCDFHRKANVRAASINPQVAKPFHPFRSRR